MYCQSESLQPQQGNLRPAEETHRRGNQADTPIGVELHLPHPVQTIGVLVSQIGKYRRADKRQPHLPAMAVHRQLQGNTLYSSTVGEIRLIGFYFRYVNSTGKQ
jgi:hypothetical protein